MNKQQTASPNAFNRAMLWILSCYLIGSFLWRMVMEADEYQGPRCRQLPAWLF
jgi:hypothetical protein